MKKSNPQPPAPKGARKPKPIKLEVGKTYLSRDGKHKATIDRIQSNGIARGKWINWTDRFARDDSWSRNGMWYMGPKQKCMEYPYDLVREVPSPTTSRRTKG